MIKQLRVNLKKKTGKNNRGIITNRFCGGGIKRKKYRIIDFYRNLQNIPCLVLEVVKDYNRTCFVTKICYLNGIISYILSAQNQKRFKWLIVGDKIPLNIGNCTKLTSLPVGIILFNLETRIKDKSKINRAAGLFIKLLRKLTIQYSLIRVSKIRELFILTPVKGTLGMASNPHQKFFKLSKAGENRRLNKKPHIRGVAMNSVDHPHGGGRGKTKGGRCPVSIWGKLTRGKKTALTKKIIFKKEFKQKLFKLSAST